MLFQIGTFQQKVQRLNTFHTSKAESVYMLDLYRLSISLIAQKTSLDACLQQFSARLSSYYPGSMIAFFVTGNLPDVATSLVCTPAMPLTCQQAMLGFPLVEHNFLIPGSGIPEQEPSEFILSVQTAAQTHGLQLSAGLPVFDNEQQFLGGILCLAQADLSAPHNNTINASLLPEIGNMLAGLIVHGRELQKLLQAEQVVQQSQTKMLRMAMAIEGSSTGIWDRDVSAGKIHYSPGWKTLLGYADEEISHHIEDSYRRVHPDDLAHVLETIKAHFEGKTEYYVVEHRVLCKDGSYKWISSRGKVVSRSDEGKPLRMIGTTTDITAMRKLTEQLKESAELVTCLTNEIPGLAYQYRMAADGEESFTYVSEGISDIYELSPAQMQDCVALVHERIHPDDFPLYRNAILQSASRLEHLHLEFRVNLPRQGVCWRQMDARPRWQAGGATLWHGFISDVTEHKRIEQELQQLATIDFLTQIPNRRSFMGRLEEEMARLQRGSSTSAAVLMCDLDNFKLINDSYGHAVGDLVLRHFAHILQDELRKSDYAGRVGGEEFAVVLAGADIADATSFAKRVQKQLDETPANAHNRLIPVTVSIGIAIMQASDSNADVSLLSSDMALYRAKEAGRNRIVVAAA